jgi:hypothetical protein
METRYANQDTLRQTQIGVRGHHHHQHEAQAEALDLRLGPGVEAPAGHRGEHDEADAAAGRDQGDQRPVDVEELPQAGGDVLDLIFEIAGGHGSGPFQGGHGAAFHDGADARHSLRRLLALVLGIGLERREARPRARTW